MANDEHVAMLKKGVDAWNKWRDENPLVHVDLSGANLRAVKREVEKDWGRKT
jgi:hypothetical protein